MGLEHICRPEPEKQDELKDGEWEEEPDDTLWPQVDFDGLGERNTDVVGWIYLEGTKINDPVVQGRDNDYYLKRTAEGKKNSAGSIFLDSRNSADFSDRNSILYGYHMKSGSMFAALDGYKKKDFTRGILRLCC